MHVCENPMLLSQIHRLRREGLRRWIFPGAALAVTSVGGIFWPEFFDLPSLLLVLGGALAVTYFSYSKTQLRDLVLEVRSLFSSANDSLPDHISELSRLTRLFQLEGLRGLENQEAYLKDPFLKQGVGLMVDLYTEEKIRARLEYLLATVLGKHEISRQVLLTLGKALPSFGLIGTLIGMVLLLKNISGQESHALPAALGLAVLTTLYGAVLANVIVAPLAARLHSIGVEKELRMRLTLDWVMMLIRGEAAAAIAGRLGVPVSAIEVGVRRERQWAPIGLSAQRWRDASRAVEPQSRSVWNRERLRYEIYDEHEVENDRAKTRRDLRALRG
jgi:chemotaxis protein MotA